MASLHIDRRADQIAAANIVAGYADDFLLTSDELATWLGVHPISVKRWIARGVGPKVTKAGLHAVRFKKSDVKQWLDERSRASAKKFGGGR